MMNSTGRTIKNGLLILMLVLAGSIAVADDSPPNKADPIARITFDDHAKQVFRQHCVSCHSANKTSGDLDLTSYGSLMQGGSSGDEIEPGAADDSYLFQLVTHSESPEMPPEGDMIPASDIDILRKWIDAGALENSGSKVKKRKRKRSLAMASASTVRPEKVAMPIGLSTATSMKTVRSPMARSIASSPWAPVVAVAAAQQVVLYNAESSAGESLLGVLAWPDGQPQVVKFSRDGSLLLGGGGRAAASGFVVLWDVNTGEVIQRVGDELDSVLATDISPMLDRIATGGPERAVRIYQVDGEEPIYELRDHTDWVTAIAYSPDGKFLATGDRNGGLMLRQADTGEELFRLTGHKAAVTDLCWRLDSKLLASSSESGKVTIWGPGNGKATKSFDTHRNGCLSVAFTRAGQLLTTGRDKRIARWDIKGKKIADYEGLDAMGVSLAFNDESQTIFAGNFSGDLKVWKLDSAKAPTGSLPTNPAKQ